MIRAPEEISNCLKLDLNTSARKMACYTLENVKDFVVEPHDSIVGDVKREVAPNMTAKESEGCQKTSTDISKERINAIKRLSNFLKQKQ